MARRHEHHDRDPNKGDKNRTGKTILGITAVALIAVVLIFLAWAVFVSPGQEGLRPDQAGEATIQEEPATPGAPEPGAHQRGVGQTERMETETRTPGTGGADAEQ